jgi:hypothetical protein
MIGLARRRKMGEACMRNSILAAPPLLAATAIAANVAGAEARWKPAYADAPYRAWFAQQHDKEGWACCDHSDAHPAYDAYIKQGKWYVPIDGTHHEIQPSQLLDGPNPTGHAVVWYDGAGDHVTIFCFAPGPMY